MKICWDIYIDDVTIMLTPLNMVLTQPNECDIYVTGDKIGYKSIMDHSCCKGRAISSELMDFACDMEHNTHEYIHILTPEQNSRHVRRRHLQIRIFLNENWYIFIQISLKFDSMGLIDKATALVRAMVWCH